MKKVEYSVIEHKRDTQIEKIMLNRGVSYADLLKPNSDYDLADCLVKADSIIPGVVKRALSVKKQYEVIQNILNHPLKGKYTLCIGSFPSDLRAKQLALMVMRNTVVSMMKKKTKGDYPIWHKVYGNYKDKWRDFDGEFTSNMLILSNISKDSTSIKIEKVRDLIEKYSNVPRIVVIGGADPIEFFATKLHLPLTAGIYLGPETKMREI